MEELIRLLKDGRSRTLEMLAMDLGTSVEKVKRDIEFLEHTGTIKRIEFTETCSQGHSCDGCTGCSTGGNEEPSPGFIMECKACLMILIRVEV